MQQVFSKSDVIVWECRNCGHIVVGTHAPEACTPIPRAILSERGEYLPHLAFQYSLFKVL